MYNSEYVRLRIKITINKKTDIRQTDCQCTAGTICAMLVSSRTHFSAAPRISACKEQQGPYSGCIWEYFTPISNR